MIVLELSRDGGIDNLRFYCRYNSTLVVSSLWKSDNERLRSLEPCSQLERILSLSGFEPGQQA